MHSTGRLWYIDSLRACLMVAGVFFHAALVYGVQTQWVVRDRSDMGAFDIAAEVLSSFRMPAFFLMAGIFWTHIRQRNTLRATLKGRVVLVSLPFLVFALTLQPLQHALLLAVQHRLALMGPREFLVTFFQPGVLASNQLFGRSVIGHLWFLLVLLAFYGLAGALEWAHARWPAAAVPDVWIERVLRHKLLAALVLGGAVLAVRSMLVHALGWSIDLANMLLYLPYFAAGALAFRREAWFRALLQLNAPDIALLGAAAAVHFVPALQARLPGAFAAWCDVAYALPLTVVLLRVFQRWLNRPSALQQRLVDASFSIYLFHYILVVGAALLLQPYPAVPAGIKYLLVVSAAFGLPLALHTLLIAHHPTLRLLINGRLPKPRQPAAPAPAADEAAPPVVVPALNP
jgi:glucan biosynthesis protein C